MSHQQPDPRRHKAIPVGLAAMPAYTVGLLAPVPFFWAALKQQTRTLWLITTLYSAVWVAIWILVGVSPDDSVGSGISGFGFIALAAGGTAHAFVLRESLAKPDAVQPAGPAVAVVSDPTSSMCAQLQAALASLKSYVAAQSDTFPPACTQLLGEIIAKLEQVVSFVSAEGHADAELRSVHSILTDYLPTSINTYVRLPREYALTQRNPDGRTPAEELELQLRLLRDSATEAARSLYRGDALRLQEQSAFLRSKFGKSELDLP